MKFVRKTANYTMFGHKRGQNILKQLRTQSVLVEINKYNSQLIQHVNNRMDWSRLPQAVMKYQLAGIIFPPRNQQSEYLGNL